MNTVTDAPVQVLLIEDNPADADLIREYLDADGLASTVELHHVARFGDALEQVRARRFDVILTDFNLPDGAGLPMLQQLHKEAPDTPIVVVTGESQNLSLALEALHHGAQDYLIKGAGTHSIHRSLRYAIERKQMQDALARNESELKQKNDELTQAYFELDRSRKLQLELKDQVLSHVSHELRTPLNAAFQFVTVLKRGIAGGLEPPQQELVEDIERNLRQLGTMIADLLDTTRAESGKLTVTLERLDMQDAIADVLRTMHSIASDKGISLAADVPGDLAPVSADPARVRQVLTNLTDNALKFTDAGGSITVRARLSEADPSRVSVSVTDTGRGIDPSEHQRIFSRLAQIEQPAGEESGTRKGLGLGLFICREIVRRHGGEIGVESRVGAGSTFYFTLPKHPGGIGTGQGG